MEFKNPAFPEAVLPQRIHAAVRHRLQSQLAIAARILSAEPNAFQHSARIPERPRFKESCAASPQSACRCQCICDFREKVCVLVNLALGPAMEPELLRAAFDASCFLGAFPPDPFMFRLFRIVQVLP